MGFFMSGLDAEAYDRTYKDSQIFRRLLGYFRSHFRIVLGILVLTILAALSDTAYPLLLSRTLDTLFSTKLMQVALELVGLILLTSLLSWTCNLFCKWFTARVVGNVTLRLREDAVAAVMEQDMSFFDKFDVGTIVSRITSDTESLASVITLLFNLFGQVLLFLLIAIILLFVSWHLALLTLIVVPAIIAFTLLFRSLARRTTRYVQRSLARINTHIQEVTSGITIAKNFRQEQNTYDEFRQINDQSYRINVRLNYLYSSIYPVLSTIANIGMAIVIYFGGAQVLGHTISVGEWFLFVQGLSTFWFPLTSIASFWNQFQQGLSASERVFALLDVEPRIHQSDHQQIEAVEGNIEIRHIVFGYDEHHTVFADFNLTIRAGETVALVGHTGAGKSSLAKLIARFYEFQGGQLLIDGQDIRTVDWHSYRHHLGIVPQVPFLFVGTIAENIRYARPEASLMEVEQVANHIGGGDWIKSLPNGLETQVGEAGKALSMGQRQLVALSRVLLQNPSIIILDEATASVDPLTETQIQEGLDMVLKDRTAIVIAHRLSTVRNADRIIVLEHGKIVEEGNHLELLKSGGYYAHLYNMYFRHQAPDYRPGEGFVQTKISPEVINTEAF